MSIFRPVYDWASRQAKKPHATGMLFLLAVTEPCLSPIPPDVLMIPMAIAHREKAFTFAITCILGVLIGSVFGYAIGALAMDTAGQWLVQTYHLDSELQSFELLFKKWGVLILVGKGFVPFIPIPLIALMVASGAASLNPFVFIITVGASQAARLFLEAWLIHHYGEPVRLFIEKYMTWIGVAACAVVGAFVALAFH